jgi:hypothetical protein
VKYSVSQLRFKARTSILQVINVSLSANWQGHIGMNISAVYSKISELRQSASVIANDSFDNKDRNK